MSIAKLKWQWQSSNWQNWQGSTNYSNDLAHVSSQPQPQVGRVITGMLTAGQDVYTSQPDHQHARSSGGSNRGKY
jgi:hypothetical protein